ncbi:META domain-containing protein [Deinococcus pimensis]|uniref:META domain-containing protein n=1 Tax=Deinococcus pimensis TaxID=309888 RepID=UPI000482EADA|nr:META domain-containing protein [Deinococcus pimensis]
MHRIALLMSLHAFVGTAHASVPASVPPSLIGIWALERPVPAKGPSGAVPRVELFISGGTLRGTYGCAKFTGRLSATSGAVRLDVRVSEPAPNERCALAADLPFARALNDVTRFVVTRDRLVLLSNAERWTFRRVGFVTPAKP